MEIKRALLSVSDKTGLVELATLLAGKGVELISTGGSASVLRENGIPVKDVSELTSFPEIFDGRVKTLHPIIHGGILGRRQLEKDKVEAKALNIGFIDLVVVNLYPFEEAVKNPNIGLNQALEKIDIGGVTLIRAAAKNFENVLILTNPSDYSEFTEKFESDSIDISFNQKMAVKGFEHTAYYDAVIASDLRHRLYQSESPLSDHLSLPYRKKETLRYGENPHQDAFYYAQPLSRNTLAGAEQLNGKALSFNNISDASAAINIVREFSRPTAVAVKHNNPCGVASGETLFEAFEKAYNADPVSIFGGIIALNGRVDVHTATLLKSIFLEIVIAPEFDDEALKILKKKKNLRVLKMDFNGSQQTSMELRSVDGGILVQSKDLKLMESQSTVTKREPNESEMQDLAFAWKIVKHVKSNAIVVVKSETTLGIGGGQTSRVWAVENAIDRATGDTTGAVLASDAFFPFSDSVELAGKAGITAIIQPGGSVKDGDSIEKCNEFNMAMVFTGMRHFKH
jgi:phosphoribosylaminoimidazolecarboxamide formyltransferase / IMP cyclohydrolase